MPLCHSAKSSNGLGKQRSQVHFHFRIASVLDPVQSINIPEPVLCFFVLLLPLQRFITLYLLPVKEEVGVSCTDDQHLQFGQVGKGALVNRVHRQPVKPSE